MMFPCTNLVFLSPYLSVGASVMTYGEAMAIEQPDLVSLCKTGAESKGD